MKRDIDIPEDYIMQGLSTIGRESPEANSLRLSLFRRGAGVGISIDVGKFVRDGLNGVESTCSEIWI